MWKTRYFDSGLGKVKCEFKIYDEPSNFGINGGRVSKLSVWIDDTLVCNYDRGWDFNNLGEKAITRLAEALEDHPELTVI